MNRNRFDNDLTPQRRSRGNRRPGADRFPDGEFGAFGAPGPFGPEAAGFDHHDRFGRGAGRGRGRGRRGGPGGFGGPPFGPPFDQRGWGGVGRPRARRGQIRAAILALLAERPMHGYEMITELADRTGGVWAPSPGSVYPKLQLLEDEGLISSEEHEGKRRFTLTDAGKAKVAERTGPAPWEQLGAEVDDGVFALREALGTTVPAVMQVAQVGTPDQQAAVVVLLAETRRSIYRILAADGAEGDAIGDDDLDAEDGDED